VLCLPALHGGGAASISPDGGRLNKDLTSPLEGRRFDSYFTPADQELQYIRNPRTATQVIHQQLPYLKQGDLIGGREQ
jgi:hypothetical protein